MNQTTSFYLIGPRKMKGQAELGADGSFDVFLKNSMASIELDIPGGSELSTWSLAAPFFSAARKSLEQIGGKVLQPNFTTTVSKGPYFPAGSAISLHQHII